MGIVIIEDNRAVRELLRSRLNRIEGVTVSGEFDDADSALAEIRSLRPQVVILDIKLQTGNALAVLKRIHRELPQSKVLMFSNHADPVFRNRFLRSGAYAIFDKSFELNQLCDTVASLSSN